MQRLPLKKTLLYGGGVTLLFGFINTITVITSHLAEGDDVRFFYPFLYETTGALTFLCIFPILVFMFERFPIYSSNWKTRVPLFLLATIPIGITHTLLMWGSRSVIFWWLNLGTYDYGIMSYRFIMEYSKQFVVFWIIYFLLRGAHYLKEKEEERHKAIELERELTNARLIALEKQLNPHFLFNTLNAISSTMFEDVEKADTMLATLSELLRQTMYNKPSGKFTIKEELAFTEKYVTLMKSRFQENLIFETLCPPDLASYPFPFLILQPLVENCIKHGLEKTGNPIRIEVEVKLEEGMLSVSILDDGPGFVQGAEARGIGLSNTKARLKHLYGDSFSFQIENRKPRGAEIKLLIPLGNES